MRLIHRNLAWIGPLITGRSHRSGKTRTFKPRKDVPEGTKQYQLRKYAEATLVSDAFPFMNTDGATISSRRLSGTLVGLG